MKAYFRKILKHDITHQISITKEVQNTFFEVSKDKQEIPVVGKYSKKAGSVTLLLATDPRFGGDITSLINSEGGMNVNDFLFFLKRKHDYELEIIRPNDLRYKTFMNLIDSERHLILQTDEVENIKDNNLPSIGDNKIFFGVPGCGKSYKVKEIVNTIDSDFVFRTTFHPDTDYASFVGCYKPISQQDFFHVYTGYSLETLAEILQKKYNEAEKKKMVEFHNFILKYADYFNGKLAEFNKNNFLLQAGLSPSFEPEINKMVKLSNLLKENGSMANDSINYEFIPQIFTNAYVKAWSNPDEKVYLIIEEINRGNCAQIFGDLFQLLDRDKATGYSEYPIKADKDLVNYLRNALGEEHDGIKNGELCLPPNLIIYATMNTSDQSLFPMDSAFKRRWEWEYVPINYGENIASGKFVITIGDTKYRWIDFLKVVNERIYQATTSEDKQMGNFFIKQDVDAKEFVNKVMFYLWNEVCKDEAGTQRNFFRKGKEEEKEFKFTDLFGDDQAIILNAFMAFLGISPIEELQSDEITAE